MTDSEYEGLPEELRVEKLKKEIERLNAGIFKDEAEAANIVLKNEAFERELSYQRAKASESRIFTFWGEVGGTSAGATIETLDTWSRKSPGEPIKIVLNSPGGAVFPGLALFDFLQDIKGRGHQLTVKTIGYAASMGGVLLQAGDERIMSPNSFLMIHEISFGMLGVKLQEAEDEVAFARRLWHKLVHILAERSVYTHAQILRKSKPKDWWIEADEALKAGFIDRIES